MSTFVMVTRVSPDALRSPKAVEALARVAMTAVRMVRELPEIGSVITVAE